MSQFYAHSFFLFVLHWCVRFRDINSKCRFYMYLIYIAIITSAIYFDHFNDLIDFGPIITPCTPLHFPLHGKRINTVKERITISNFVFNILSII